uniref:RxLR effector protein n=1 Tax=Phytophthora ramorum TaxID=164328 RepID=H3H7Y0_PHYRM
MRACYLLLVAATTLLATVSAATDADNTKLSQMTTSDTIQSIDAAQAATTKRFLRRYKVTEEDEESEDDLENEESEDDTEDEERAIPNIKVLDDVVENVAKSKVTDDAIMKIITNGKSKENMNMFNQLFENQVTMQKLEQLVKTLPKEEASKITQFYQWFREIKRGESIRAAANAAA